MTIKELRTRIDNASQILEDASELIDKTMEEDDIDEDTLMTLKVDIEQAQEILDEVFYEAQDIEATIIRVIKSMKEALANNTWQNYNNYQRRNNNAYMERHWLRL